MMPTEVPSSIEHMVRAARAQSDDWLDAIVTATGIIPASAAADARLTLGLPGPANEAQRRLDNHLLWWPTGLPHERLVGVVSSRLSRQLERWAAWFLGLRALCATVDPAHQRLLIVADTTTGRFAERAAELFGLSTLRVATASTGTLENWWRTVAAVNQPGELQQQLFVSPPITAAAGEAPLRDVLTMELADELTALFVRPAGNIARLLQARLVDGRRPSGTSRLLLGQGLTSARVRDELLDNGCVGWHVARADTALMCPDDGEPPPDGRVAPLSATRAEPWEWLTHCTRRCYGPWPEQPENDYLDELILDTGAAGRSALATLRQIVTDQRLIAAARGVRGQTAVVCFTAVPLAELDRLRIFRPHRGRWDFQPYGICIRRSWLASRGARPVRYAATKDWDDMPARERPYFQVEQSLTKAGNTIDWTVEEEWRLTGDVSLDEIPRQSAFLFVPTAAEAHELAPLSRWPVYVLNVSQGEVDQ